MYKWKSGGMVLFLDDVSIFKANLGRCMHVWWLVGVFDDLNAFLAGF
jgi:hypothetical protein